MHDHEQDLESLKQGLRNISVLSYHDEEKFAGLMILTCDASSKNACAGVLSQLSPDCKTEYLLS